MNKLKNLLYLAAIIVFCAFTFQSNPPGGWYLQTLPFVNGQRIQDLIFLDSLTGFIITSKAVNPDSSTILKTTNGGDNWNIISAHPGRRFSRIQFANSNTGYISGGTGAGTPYLYKTTDGGNNWTAIPSLTGTAFWDNIAVINVDTIFGVDGNSFNGGIYRSTNGGINWQIQSGGSPNHIYMYNSRIGFADAFGCVKTTNGGTNWFFIPGADFSDMYFIDSLRGWKSNGSFEKTTNGGLNWQEVPIPPKGGNIFLSRIEKFHNINSDTIFGVGSLGIVQSVARGLIYKTTNGGITWGYQKIDTSINVFRYFHVQFTDKIHGWAFGTGSGVHTVTGGDSNILLAVNQIGSIVPDNYELKQNYPNPFNPITKISFSVKGQRSNMKLIIYDITGKVISELVNQVLNAGEYVIDFNGNNLSSGTYFYSLYIDNNLIDTKKMLLLK